MKTTAKTLKRQPETKQMLSAKPSPVQSKGQSRRERVLIEFPAGLLQQTDEVARSLHRNRSELIRSAVEKLLNEMEAEKLEKQLAAAYSANAEMNRKLSKEFEAVDREGF